MRRSKDSESSKSTALPSKQAATGGNNRRSEQDSAVETVQATMDDIKVQNHMAEIPLLYRTGLRLGSQGGLQFF